MRLPGRATRNLCILNVEEPHTQASNLGAPVDLASIVMHCFTELNVGKSVPFGSGTPWRQFRREQIAVARSTIERLMGVPGLQGAVCGTPCRTTMPGDAAHRSPDLVNRQFVAERPKHPWMADITHVPARPGFVYMAFVINMFSRRMVGWRVASSMKTGLLLDALAQALWARNDPKGPVHYSDSGGQYLSIRLSERLPAAEIEHSIGSGGNSDDSAPAETIIGAYTTEVIHWRRPLRNRNPVEYATLEWADWFNNRMLPKPIGHFVPPAEFEAAHRRQQEKSVMTAQLNPKGFRNSRGDSLNRHAYSRLKKVPVYPGS